MCQLGRAALDGSFNDFIEQGLALSLQFESGQTTFTTWRGDPLRLDETGRLWVNAALQPGAEQQHYNSPYCTCALDAPLMEMRFGPDTLRLHFTDPVPAPAAEI